MTENELLAKSQSKPVFVAFLRHTGCTFCREWVKKISARQEEIKAKGMDLAFVHMSPAEQGEKFLRDFGVKDFVAISDPKLHFYKRLGAKHVSPAALLKFSVWKNLLKKGLFEGYGAGLPVGDGFQLGGFAVISKGKVVQSRWADAIDSEPEFDDLISGTA